jgi:predicted phage terminase large subunit-like protein
MSKRNKPAYDVDIDLERLAEQYPDATKELLKLTEALNAKQLQRNGAESFLTYVKHMWPDFVEGRHHQIFAEKLERVARGELKRLIINMPPRHTKSEFASTYFPSWVLGRNPKLKVMQITHTAELAFRFGRRVRDIIDSPDYQHVFPGVALKADSKSAGRWETNGGGEAFYSGIGGAVTGRGADLLVLDDIHSEQDALSPTALDNAWEYYSSGPRQRLQPGGAIVIVMTRWSTKDLTGRLLSKQAEDHADQWEVVEFPAIFPETNKALWPEYWKLEELQGVKASIPVSKWEAQWMQNPTSEEGAILKREWWKTWSKKEIPEMHFVIQSYDTAFSKKETADYSAITTWCVFHPEEDSSRPALLLLDVKKGRWDFPELKRVAVEQYKYWDPDTIIIEAKASGMPLTDELRQAGIPVVNYSPGKGQDKITRVNTVAPILESGMVYVPETRWAEELVEECAAFPFGDYDDLVDSTTQALLRYRQGGFIGLESDYYMQDNEPRRIKEYY